MAYTDAEMMIATQIAYLNYNDKGNDRGKNVGELVESILKNNGTYDASTGTYVLKKGVTGVEKAQFETAQNIWKLSEQNNVVSWRQWKIVNRCNQEQGSGYYGCLIDTGDGGAIIGCRGSESCDLEQTVKDWIIADVGRVDNELTAQQADATKYMEELYYGKYLDKYDHIALTGHSLGGSLATHSAISSPEGMQEKIDSVISFDGPGFSDEYLNAHKEQIDRVRDKLNHYEWSWVGGLLNQPDGINDRVIKAHDDEAAGDINLPLWVKMLLAKGGIPSEAVEKIIGLIAPSLVRHHTRNVEFDKNGNIIDGDRGTLQKFTSPLSKDLENTDSLFQRGADIFLLLVSILISMGTEAYHDLEKLAKDIADKVRKLYSDFLSMVVSGEYEIHTKEMTSIADEMDDVQKKLDRIADEVQMIRRDLPYDSFSAYYYKNCLGKISGAIVSEGKKAKKLGDAANKAVVEYTKGDQRVQEVF